MYNLTINVGQGESKTLLFKITTSIFNDLDKILFAVKTDNNSRKTVLSFEQTVSELSLDNGTYSFVVHLTSEQTRALALRTYCYDLTLIDSNGQNKPLMEPADFIVNATVGASVRREE